MLCISTEKNELHVHAEKAYKVAKDLAGQMTMRHCLRAARSAGRQKQHMVRHAVIVNDIIEEVRNGDPVALRTGYVSGMIPFAGIWQKNATAFNVTIRPAWGW